MVRHWLEESALLPAVQVIELSLWKHLYLSAINQSFFVTVIYCNMIYLSPLLAEKHKESCKTRPD